MASRFRVEVRSAKASHQWPTGSSNSETKIRKRAQRAAACYHRCSVDSTTLTSKPLVQLTVSSTPQYLADRGFDPASLKVSELAGGVSNIVLLVEHFGGAFVL